MARGRFLAFLDADDYWLPDKLEKQIRVMESASHLGLIYSYADVVDAGGRKLWTMGTDRPPAESAGADLFACFLLGFTPPALTVLARHECVRDSGGFDETITYVEDWDLWMRIAARWEVGHVPEALACYSVQHRYLPEVYDRHDLQTKWPYVVNKALAARPDVDPQLRASALKRALWLGVFTDFAVRKVAAGQQRLRQGLHSGQAGGLHNRTVMEALTGFARHLYDDFTPHDEATAFLTFFLANLPEEYRQLQAQERWGLGSLLRFYAFEARKRGDKVEAKRMMRRAASKRPGLLLDIGTWTTALTGTWRDAQRTRARR